MILLNLWPQCDAENNSDLWALWWCKPKCKLNNAELFIKSFYMYIQSKEINNKNYYKGNKENLKNWVRVKVNSSPEAMPFSSKGIASDSPEFCGNHLKLDLSDEANQMGASVVHWHLWLAGWTPQTHYYYRIALCLSWSMAAMLNDFFIMVARACPQAILVAIITMRKSIHQFPFLSYIYKYAVGLCCC